MVYAPIFASGKKDKFLYDTIIVIRYYRLNVIFNKVKCFSYSSLHLFLKLAGCLLLAPHSIMLNISLFSYVHNISLPLFLLFIFLYLLSLLLVFLIIFRLEVGKIFGFDMPAERLCSQWVIFIDVWFKCKCLKFSTQLTFEMQEKDWLESLQKLTKNLKEEHKHLN